MTYCCQPSAEQPNFLKLETVEPVSLTESCTPARQLQRFEIKGQLDAKVSAALQPIASELHLWSNLAQKCHCANNC